MQVRSIHLDMMMKGHSKDILASLNGTSLPRMARNRGYILIGACFAANSRTFAMRTISTPLKLCMQQCRWQRYALCLFERFSSLTHFWRSLIVCIPYILQPKRCLAVTHTFIPCRTVMQSCSVYSPSYRYPAPQLISHATRGDI